MSSILTSKYYSQVNLRAHDKIKNLVAEEWRLYCPNAFNQVHSIATKLAKEAHEKQLSILPAESDLFAAFNECSPSSTKVVIIGERPLIGGNGKCFDMPVSNGMPPSLRNIINDIRNDTGRDSLALSNANSYLRHLPKQGVLLLNYALTRYQENEISHRKYWASFTIELIKEMQQLKNITFVVTSSNIDIEKYISKYNHLINYYPGQPSNAIFAKLAGKYNIIF